ncbi:aquaporin AQPAn.G-like isoform X2 [Ochlerotatus camptorhynchus]|uniref:aquaporin AQPAn.G-like isoform X2 n=1 Tax=Ochlerotatus camptorhynchus TaxID=644619 RepID=UPI0031D95CFB
MSLHSLLDYLGSTGRCTRDVVSIFLAEFCGTATLLFLGCMCVVSGFGNSPTNVAGGIGFGFTVMIVIIIFGHISGAHINPCVSIAAVVYGTLNIPMFILYLIAQFSGGICGYGLLMSVTPMKYFAMAMETGNGSCATAPHSDLSIVEAFGVEFFITGILVWTCCGLWDPRNSKFGEDTPVKFALIVGGISIASGPYTGASMNPARTLPPAIWNGSYKALWVYFIAPPLAGLVMPLIYKYVFRREPLQEEQTAVQLNRRPEDIRAPMCVCVCHPLSLTQPGALDK